MLLSMFSLCPNILAGNKGQGYAGLGVCQKQREARGTELPGNERNRRSWKGREQFWRLETVSGRVSQHSSLCPVNCGLWSFAGRQLDQPGPVGDTVHAAVMRSGSLSVDGGSSGKTLATELGDKW